MAAADSELLLHNDTDLSQVTYEVDAVSTADAPIKKGEKLGTAKVFIGDTEYGTIDLVASEDIERSDVLYALFQVQEFFKSPLFRIILVVLILLILLLVFVSTKRAPRPPQKAMPAAAILRDTADGNRLFHFREETSGLLLFVPFIRCRRSGLPHLPDRGRCNHSR